MMPKFESILWATIHPALPEKVPVNACCGSMNTCCGSMNTLFLALLFTFKSVLVWNIRHMLTASIVRMKLQGKVRVELRKEGQRIGTLVSWPWGRGVSECVQQATVTTQLQPMAAM